MSFFSDFVLASKQEAKKVGRTPNPTQHWPGFACKNLMCLDLASLYAAIQGKAGTEAVLELDEEFELLECGKKSVELCLFPQRFTELLADVELEAKPGLVERWQADAEYLADWEVQDVRWLLDNLCALAQQAVADGKPILLCNSGF
jgi:hypothetical protein